MQSFQIFPSTGEGVNEKALCVWKHEEKLHFGIIDLTTARCRKIKFDADKEGECKTSVSVDSFAVAQGKKLFCFNDKGDKWR